MAKLKSTVTPTRVADENIKQALPKIMNSGELYPKTNIERNLKRLFGDRYKSSEDWNRVEKMLTLHCVFSEVNMYTI